MFFFFFKQKTAYEIYQCDWSSDVFFRSKVAREIGVPPRRINEIVHGKRAISADTALRLAKYFAVSESFWMGLQADYDLEQARWGLGKKLDKIHRVRPEVEQHIQDSIRDDEALGRLLAK